MRSLVLGLMYIMHTSYYREHIFNETNPKHFLCFDEISCQGTTILYKHDISLRSGDVPINGLCMNFNYQSESYGLSEVQYYYGDNIS